MLDVEHFVQERYPRLLLDRPLLAKPLLTALRLLFHEKEIRQFGANYPTSRASTSSSRYSTTSTFPTGCATASAITSRPAAGW